MIHDVLKFEDQRKIIKKEDIQEKTIEKEYYTKEEVDKLIESLKNGET